MTTRTFDKAPAGLPLMLKAALPAIPVVGNLPGIKHQKGGLPETTLRRNRVTTDLAHLDRYNEVCGFSRSETLPATYPHIAAHTLHLSLMTDTAFPFPPMGAVHLRNRITQYRPIGREEIYDLSLHAASDEPHPKGRLISLVSEARVGGELVWDETMTVLFRSRTGGDEPLAPPLAGVEAPEGVVHWKLGSDLGRRYGAVSGDRNPIHLYPWTAKAFGFPRQIAHGMWTKAHSLATLQNRLPDSYTVDVEFKKPVLLPSTVVFGTDNEGEVTTFGVRDSRKSVPHLVGRITPV
ncbi:MULTISPECIES: MaoC/PaaZ C-terminal domain-containing protein [Aeromicrobium]|nr:MaoC/PaaZ C-terminal domain-containing protein [Aeromicrobium sp. 636]